MVEFLASLHWGVIFQIIMIDLLLGGDNAVIIALACRNLPEHLKLKGVLWGTVGAIVLRVIFIIFAVSLLDVPFLKMIGGLLLFWIAFKLILQKKQSHNEIAGPEHLKSAIKTIVLADAVMSIDNVIAIAGAAEAVATTHRLGLVIFGLLFSIPIIVFGSQMILRLLNRWPWIAIFGAALLGWIAGSLIVSDPIVNVYLNNVDSWRWIVSSIAALSVLCIGFCLKRKNEHG